PLSVPTFGKQLTVKVDHRATTADQLSFRFYRNHDRSDTVPSDQSSPLLEGGNSTKVNSATLNEVHTFSPTLLGEVSVAYTRLDWDSLASSANKSPKELGGKYNQDGSQPLAPAVNVVGRFSLGNSRISEPEDHVQIDGKLSWMVGNHSLKFGAKIMRIR